MKTILIMFLFVAQCYSQDCKNDVKRKATYDYMEVFNHASHKYEKYNKVAATSLTVVVSSEDNLIMFKDDINKYNKKFYIVNCETKDSSIVYNCIDSDNSEKAQLVFGTDNEFYLLKVIYIPEPIIYRVKQNKIK